MLCGSYPAGGHYLTLETGIGERQLMFDGGEEFLHWLKRSSLVACIRYPWFGAVMAFKPVTFRQHSSKHGPHHKVSLEKGCGTSAMDGILRTSWPSANSPGTFLEYSIQIPFLEQIGYLVHFTNELLTYSFFFKFVALQNTQI